MIQEAIKSREEADMPKNVRDIVEQASNVRLDEDGRKIFGELWSRYNSDDPELIQRAEEVFLSVRSQASLGKVNDVRLYLALFHLRQYAVVQKKVDYMAPFEYN